MTWQHAGELAVVLAVGGGLMSRSRSAKVRAVGAFAREAAMIGVLYGLWQLAGRLNGLSTDGALGRAQWIQQFQSDIHLPSEPSVQDLILPHPLIVEVANLYYATMHFTMMFTFLIWMFIRHRERYRPVRSVLALTTLCCLLIQLIPVAPPRMLPGVVDTGVVYHQSVYGGGFDANQLSAMPSVHAAWAVCVGFYVWQISPSRWRFIGPLHAALTIFVVVATGNHWWLDCIVAALVLVGCAWGVAGIRKAWHAARSRWSGRSRPEQGQRLGQDSGLDRGSQQASAESDTELDSDKQPAAVQDAVP